MRIGFAGNTNNAPFLIARALRAQGHDVQMVIDRPEPLHRPENRYRDVSSPYPHWIHAVDAIDVDDVAFETGRWARVLAVLGTCDALVLNGTMFAAAADLDLPAVAVSTGSDLEFYCHPGAAEAFARMQDYPGRERRWRRAVAGLDSYTAADLVDIGSQLPSPAFRLWRKYVFARAVARQWRGLRAARAIMTLPRGAMPVSDGLLDRIGVDQTPRLLGFWVDLANVRPLPLPANETLRVFCPTRLNWHAPFPTSMIPGENKRGDVLIRGVAAFQAHTGRRVELHLVAKGHAVSATRELVNAVGLGTAVVWHEEMSQADVIANYTQADVVADQFGDHLVGMAGYEAMASGRPLLCNWRPEVFGTAFGEMAPVAQARTPDEVVARLTELSSRDARTRLARAGRAWVERHLALDRLAATVVVALSAPAVPLARRGSAPRRRAA